MLFNIILHAYQIYFENFWACFFLSPLQHYYNMTIPEYHHTNIDIMISLLQYYLSNITGRRFAAARVSTFYKHQLFQSANIKISSLLVEVHFNFEEVLLDRINIGLITGASSDKELSGVQWLQKKKEKTRHWNFGN